MKITEIETFVVDAGWRPWLFVAVRTENGITGYGEMSDGRNPFGIVGAINDLKPILVGYDPLAIEARYQDMYRMTRQSPGGIAAKAMAGIELALWDIKGKAHGVPVYSLFGGPTRDTQQVYWSHCGTSRANNYELIGVPPLETLADVTALGKEVISRGFSALKTNIVFPGKPAEVHFGGFYGGPGTTDQNVSSKLLDHIEKYIGTLKDAVGKDVKIALDLNFNFKPHAAKKICMLLEKFDMMWVEIDLYDPSALAEVKYSTSIDISSGENLITMRDYRPFFEARAMDVVMIDIPWQGFSRSRDVAMLAESYELNIAPHNYYSNLATHIGLNLCASVPNVRIMEVDIDDVPWKDDLTGSPLKYHNGHLDIPTGPGWGLNLNEELAKKYEWGRNKGPGEYGVSGQRNS